MYDEQIQITMADCNANTKETKQGTYRTYKEDTDKFLTWLAKTAQSHGHQIETKSAPRLKGKAIKEGRDAMTKDPTTDTHPLSLQDFTACAEFIVKARKPKITISPSILAIAYRALTVRKKFANWFATNKGEHEEDVRGNRSHQYFNHWLEELLLALKPCEDALTAKEKSSPAAVPNHDLDINNLFTELDIEEPSLEEASNEEAVADQTTSPSREGNSLKYTLKDNEEERYIGIFCLYEDLNRLRREIIRMWTLYKLGKVDLVSVSLATNSALEHGI